MTFPRTQHLNFPVRAGHVPNSTTLLPPPPREVHLWYTFFGLLAMNSPLPAELKFRENTATIMFTRLVFTTAGVRFHFILHSCLLPLSTTIRNLFKSSSRCSPTSPQYLRGQSIQSKTWRGVGLNLIWGSDNFYVLLWLILYISLYFLYNTNISGIGWPQVIPPENDTSNQSGRMPPLQVINNQPFNPLSPNIQIQNSPN